MKRTILFAIAICITLGTSAERRTIKDRTDNWLQRENTEVTSDETTSGDLRIGDAPAAPTVPIGEGLLTLIVLAGAYAVSKKRQKA